MIVQTFDAIGGDAHFVSCVQFNTGESLSSGSFVIINDSESSDSWFAELVSPPLNINSVSAATGPIAVHQIKAIAEKRYPKEVLVDDTRFYQFRLLSMESDGVRGSVRRRPRTASTVRAATQEEIEIHLNLPDPAESIGHLISMPAIPIGVNGHTLLHHVGVCGSTGSGKTNTIANLMYVCQQRPQKASVVVFDHKPDYQECSIPVDGYDAMQAVKSYSLKGGSLFVEACDLEPAVFAQCVFYKRSEDQQREVFETMLEMFDRERNSGKWTWADFRAWLKKQNAADWNNTDKRTWNAMVSKLGRSGRLPSWVNSKQSRLSGDPVNIEDMLTAVGTHVFDVSGGNGRHYALFLSYILGKMAFEKTRLGSRCVPVVIVVDEAQDIFNSSESGVSSLAEHIRKGRSLQMGFIIGVQSASFIPTDIRNNLNSVFLMKHLNPDQAREAVSTLTREQLASLRTFGPGECFAYIHGSTTTVHAQMDLSPFELTKPKDEWI